MRKKGQTFLLISGLAVLSIHVWNRISYRLCTSKNLLSSSDVNDYEWRFGTVKYSKKGSGSPLLLIHNLTPGSSSYEFHFLTEKLASNHEVYTLDLLGYGLSDKPNMTYTNYLYVQLLIDFIKNVIGRKTDILATGDSAAIAVMAAHNDPEVFRNLILVNPQNINRLNKAPSKRMKLLKIFLDSPIIGTFVYNRLTGYDAMKKIFLKEYFYAPCNLKNNYVQTYTEAAHLPDYNSKFTYTSHCCRYMNNNITHALKGIDHSIYLIYGEKLSDSELIAKQYVSCNSSIETFSIPASRLLPQLEQPEELLETIELVLG